MQGKGRAPRPTIQIEKRIATEEALEEIVVEEDLPTAPLGGVGRAELGRTATRALTTFGGPVQTRDKLA